MTDLILLSTTLPPSTRESLALEIPFFRGAFERVFLVSVDPHTAAPDGVAWVVAHESASGIARLAASPAAWSWMRTARHAPGGLARVREAMRLRDAVPAGDAVLMALGADAAIALAMRRHRGDTRPSTARLSRADVADLDPLRRRALAGVDRLFVVNPEDRDALRRADSNLGARGEVFPAGIPDPRCACRASEDGVLRILSCGDVHGSTRLRLLVSALRKCSRAIEWTHVGTGAGVDALVQSAASLPAPTKVRFLRKLSPGSVTALFRDEAIDLFFDAGEDEHGRLSVLRAFAHGVPVFSVGGAGDPLLDGFVLPADVPTTELATRLEALALASDAERNGRRGAARARWLSSGDAASQLPAFAESLRALRPVAA